MSDNNRRVIALILAVFAALLVILAGKACARDIQRTNEMYRTTAAPDMHISLADPSSVVTPTSQAAQQTEENAVTEPTVQVVTDLIGRVVGTVPPTSEGETMDMTEPTTKKKSILEEYNEEQASKEAALNPTEVSTDADAGAGYVEAAPAQSQISINVY